jgi:hypothetical protein
METNLPESDLGFLWRDCHESLYGQMEDQQQRRRDLNIVRGGCLKPRPAPNTLTMAPRKRGRPKVFLGCRVTALIPYHVGGMSSATSFHRPCATNPVLRTARPDGSPMKRQPVAGPSRTTTPGRSPLRQQRLGPTAPSEQRILAHTGMLSSNAG